jgi:pimeloyl-ACP methyl ester carboxylesterase
MAEDTLGDLAARSERWAGLRSEFVDVRGTRVHVVRGGRSAADGGDPTPHLLVHGLGGNASNWFEVMQALGHDREVIAVDLPGFGRTVPPRASASRVRANARFLPVFCDALGIERAVVHGNSMGGLVAVLHAALAPERVDRLVLAAPALPSARADLTQLPPMALTRFAPFVVPGAGTSLLRMVWNRSSVDFLMEEAVKFTTHDPAALSLEMLEIMRENIAYAKRHAWRIESLAYATESMVASLVGGREVNDAIAQATARTLVVWGDGDPAGRPTGARPSSSTCGRTGASWNSQGVGHVPMMDAGQRYVAAVLGWMAGRPDRGGTAAHGPTSPGQRGGCRTGMLSGGRRRTVQGQRRVRAQSA